MKNTIFMVNSWYLEADHLISNNEISEAIELLERILLEEPGYGKAHNALGWIYFHKLDEYVKAENHFRAGIRMEPDLPMNYLNLVYLLNYLRRTAEVRTILDLAVSVPGSALSILYHEYGRSFEMEGHHKLAYNWYIRAIDASMDKAERESYIHSKNRAFEKWRKHRFSILKLFDS